MTASIPTILAAILVAMTAFAFFWSVRHPVSWNLAAVVGLTIGVRAVAALLSIDEGTYDLDSYRGVAQAVLAGQDVYGHALDGRYPYLPGWDAWIALTYLAARGSDYVFGLLYRLPIIAADAGIAVILFRRVGPALALLHALNPLSVVVSGYHGQFDSLPLLAAVMSLTVATPVVAGAAIGVGIWIKTWPALLLLSLLGRFGKRRGIQACIVAAVVATVGSFAVGAVTHADPVALAVRVLTYRSGYDWGLPPLLAGTRLLPSWWMALAGPVILLAYMLVRRARGEAAAACALVLATLTIAPGGAAQYVTWLGPLALLVGETAWLGRLVAATLLYYFVGFFGALPDDPSGRLWDVPIFWWWVTSLPSWAVVTAWLLDWLRQAVLNERGSARTSIAGKGRPSYDSL